MKVFKIDLVSYIKHLWSVVLCIIVTPFIGHYLIISRLGSYTPKIGISIAIFIFVLFILPSFILLVNHLFFNKGDEFRYVPSSGRITYIRRGEKNTFDIQNLNKITVFKSWALAEERTLVLPWDEFNYSVMELKSGEIYKISSLLVYELDKVLKFDNTEIKKTLYAWMS